MQDIFGLDQRKSELLYLFCVCMSPSKQHTSAACSLNSLSLVADMQYDTGAARWQATAFQLGIVMSAAGLLVMLLTALKSFGAAELLGQVVHSAPATWSSTKCTGGTCCKPLKAMHTLTCRYVETAVNPSIPNMASITQLRP